MTGSSTGTTARGPGLRERWPVVPFVAWTGYVWVTRIANAWSDADATQAVKLGATALSVPMLLAALAVVVVTVRAAGRALTRGEAGVYRGAAVLTGVVWAIRGAQIALADYANDPDIANPTGFKVVHLVLGLLSITLAALVWRVAGRDGADAAPPTGTPTVSPGVGTGR